MYEEYEDVRCAAALARMHQRMHDVATKVRIQGTWPRLFAAVGWSPLSQLTTICSESGMAAYFAKFGRTGRYPDGRTDGIDSFNATSQ